MTAVELRHVSRNGVTHGIGLMGHRPGDNYSIGKTARGLFCKIGILRLMFLRSLYVHLPIDPLCCPPLTATQATLVVGRRLRYPCRGVLRTSSAGELLRTKGRMEKTASHFAFPVLPHPILHCLSCSSPSSLPPIRQDTVDRRMITADGGRKPSASILPQEGGARHGLANN